MVVLWQEMTEMAYGSPYMAHVHFVLIPPVITMSNMVQTLPISGKISSSFWHQVQFCKWQSSMVHAWARAGISGSQVFHKGSWWPPAALWDTPLTKYHKDKAAANTTSCWDHIDTKSHPKHKRTIKGIYSVLLAIWVTQICTLSSAKSLGNKCTNSQARYFEFPDSLLLMISYVSHMWQADSSPYLAMPSPSILFHAKIIL